ncbi:MAG: hypothetical protein K1X79_03645 [Oligoflexia bacterium]|nr:hypothetical protein [Oligoflexia bacterium]
MLDQRPSQTASGTSPSGPVPEDLGSLRGQQILAVSSIPAVFLPIDLGGRLVVYELLGSLFVRAHPVAHALALQAFDEELAAHGVSVHEATPIACGHISIHPGYPNTIEVDLPGGSTESTNILVANMIAASDPCSRVRLA